MNPLRRRRLAGLAAVGAIALVAGCGGGSDESASTPSTAATSGTVAGVELSAEEFRARASAVCADAQSQIDDVPDPTSADEVAATFDRVVPIAEERLEGLRALDPPAELQSSFDEALQLGEEQLDLAGQIRDRVGGGEEVQAVVTELTPELDRLEARSDALAAELGVPECADDEAGTGSSTTATATAPAATDATTDPGAGSGGIEPTQYLGDVQAAAGALSSFGTLLQSVSSPSDLTDKAPEARERLDAFDSAIAKIGAYTLEDPRLERQRAGLARTGPRVSRTLRDFTDAASEGDLAEIQRLIPEIQSAIGDFQSAATDVG